MKDQFTFYRSFWETIQLMPTNSEKLQIFEILCQYGLDGKEPDLKSVKPSAAAIFGIAKPIIDTTQSRLDRFQTVNDPS